MEKKVSNIYTALLEVQAGAWLVKKTSDNPFYKSTYADLAAVSQTCREAMTKAGLVVIQLPIVNEHGAGCLTRIVHAETQEAIENELVLPLGAKRDAQAVGSCITYARRYSLGALIGIVAQDEDDDGNNAVKSGPGAEKPKQTKKATTTKELPSS
jgi:hypothetical protein